jgi:hypothetical protein
MWRAGTDDGGVAGVSAVLRVLEPEARASSACSSERPVRYWSSRSLASRDDRAGQEREFSAAF